MLLALASVSAPISPRSSISAVCGVVVGVGGTTSRYSSHATTPNASNQTSRQTLRQRRAARYSLQGREGQLLQQRPLPPGADGIGLRGRRRRGVGGARLRGWRGFGWHHGGQKTTGCRSYCDCQKTTRRAHARGPTILRLCGASLV